MFRYLLITSAALHADAIKAGVRNLVRWPKEKLPSTPAVAPEGRIAVLVGEDEWKVERRIRELLEDTFKVSHSMLRPT
jgi:hypothetical protein